MGRGSCFTSFYISFLFLKQISKHLDIGIRRLGHHTHFPGPMGKGAWDYHVPLEMYWGGGMSFSSDGLLSPFGQNSGLEPGPAPSLAPPGLPGLGPASDE